MSHMSEVPLYLFPCPPVTPSTNLSTTQPPTYLTSGFFASEGWRDPTQASRERLWGRSLAFHVLEYVVGVWGAERPRRVVSGVTPASRVGANRRFPLPDFLAGRGEFDSAR